MNDLNLGVIGNSTLGALIDPRGRFVWACMPRLDGDPVFCSLLDDGKGEPEAGFFAIDIANFARSEQRYLHNSAILVTTLHDTDGSAVEITDFAPRFKRLDRIFRPMMIVRRVRPLAGSPRITIRLRPRFNWGAENGYRTRGSNHVRFVGPDLTLRCNTDAPVMLLTEELSFLLEEPISMMLGPDESMTSPIDQTCNEFYRRTLDYWQEWSRYLAVPFEWQDAVIRAAITLKLCAFEESGGIVAAMTTSVPEAPHTQRNWDYRYCWLRDAYFVVQALNRLGTTRTMESLLHFLDHTVARSDEVALQPLYGIGGGAELPERVVDSLSGYRGMGPVRVGNAAYAQVQHDVYGAVILAATQMFFDQRLTSPGDHAAFARLEKIGECAIEVFAQPDAGPWEFRGIAQVHTFSSLMSWAGCDRLARIADHLGLAERAQWWRGRATPMRRELLQRAWNPALGRFSSVLDGEDLDATLLLMPEFGLVEGTDPRFVATLEAVQQRLGRGRWLMRYSHPDDFGYPETAFTICGFWLVNALHAAGRLDEARERFEVMLAARTRLGLLSEDIDPATGELWGNFPQTYSLVGIIQCATRLSRPWEDAR